MAPQMAPGAAGSETMQADSLFSFFQERKYTQLVTLSEIRRLKNDRAFYQENIGKRFKAVGKLNPQRLSLSHANSPDLILLLNEGNNQEEVHKEFFFLQSRREAFIDKVTGNVDGESTIYFTVKRYDPAGAVNFSQRIHLDAVRRPDGKIMTL